MKRIVCSTGMMVPVGLVSEGSLRAEDLLSAALHTYEAVNPAGFVVMSVEYAAILRPFAATRTEQINVGTPFNFTEAQIGRIIALCGEVVEDINNALPDGWFYGGHPDDPACVGIWQTDEMAL